VQLSPSLGGDISETEDELAREPELAKRLLAKLAELKKDLPAAPPRRAPGMQQAPRP
jgi:hypothetical protein